MILFGTEPDSPTSSQTACAHLSSFAFPSLAPDTMTQAAARIIGDLSKEDDQMIRILRAVEHQSAHVMTGRKQIGVSFLLMFIHVVIDCHFDYY